MRALLLAAAFLFFFGLFALFLRLFIQRDQVFARKRLVVDEQFEQLLKQAHLLVFVRHPVPLL